MGNRAIITTAPVKGAPGIYLHWNGGRDSVTAFLMVARQLDLDEIFDPRERMDAFGQMLAEHFFGTEYGQLHVYPHTMSDWDDDQGDNGVYVIDQSFRIVGRLFAPTTEQDEYSLIELFEYILHHVHHGEFPQDEEATA